MRARHVIAGVVILGALVCARDAFAQRCLDDGENAAQKRCVEVTCCSPTARCQESVLQTLDVDGSLIETQVATCMPFSSSGDPQCLGKGAYTAQNCGSITCCSPLECHQTLGQFGNPLMAECVEPEQPPAPPPPERPVTFVPQVTVPGSITIGGKTFTVRAGEGIAITTSTAAQYFALFYRFFVAMLAVVAVVMVMWGGFKRIMAAGSPTSISDANDTIFSALSGLVIALISYSLLSLVNPVLVDLQPLDAITPIDRIEFSLDGEETEPTEVAGSSDITAMVIFGDNIVNSGQDQADRAIVLDLRKVALKLREQGITLVIASGLRSEAKQRQLIAQNCQNPPGSATCNPKPGRPVTCMLRNGLASCPHTTGRAVDVWAAVGNINPISQKDCLANKLACRQDKAMAAMGQAMLEEGFCNLASEPWHFEKPKMSSTCQTTY